MKLIHCGALAALLFSSLATLAQDCSFADKHPAAPPDFIKRNHKQQPMPNAFWAGKTIVLIKVDILVDQQGRVEDTCVSEDQHPPLGLITASRAAARKWTFKPIERRKKIYQEAYVKASILFRYVPQGDKVH